jgi:hypothetical protein
MAAAGSTLRAEAGVAGGCRCSEETTSMAAMETVTTTMTRVETQSIVPSPAMERKNKKSEMEMAWIHAYRMVF